MDSEKRIGVIGLGYVGLPLAVEFAKKYAVTGFDISEKRVNELRSGNDRTLEISKSALLSVLKKENNGSDGFYASNNADDIASCNIYIITVLPIILMMCMVMWMYCCRIIRALV